MIRRYTREAGVRNLERELSTLARKAVKELMISKKKSVKVTEKTLEDFLGVPKYRYGEIESEPQVGIVTGLAWTDVGGELLTIEGVMMPGKGKMTVTGNLRDVMKESISAAASYVRSRAIVYGIEPPLFDRRDIHVHVPEGATPKDGPSAGVAMATAIISVMTGIPVRHDVAMTGEITLRGRVLPIGGLKEKLLAAARGGIKTVLIPEDNAKDLTEISDAIKGGMEIIPVARLDDVIAKALVRDTGADRLGRGHQGAGQARRRRRGGRWPDGALDRDLISEDDKTAPSGAVFVCADRLIGQAELKAMEIDGQCHCGRVTYRADIDPAKVSICHCTDCQTLTGSPYRVTVICSDGQVRMTGAPPKIYAKTRRQRPHRASSISAPAAVPRCSPAARTAGRTTGASAGAASASATSSSRRGKSGAVPPRPGSTISGIAGTAGANAPQPGYRPLHQRGAAGLNRRRGRLAQLVRASRLHRDASGIGSAAFTGTSANTAGYRP